MIVELGYLRERVSLNREGAPVTVCEHAILGPRYVWLSRVCT